MAQERDNPAGQRLRVRRKRLLVCAGIAVVLIPLALGMIDHFWPYRYRNVEPTLETVFASDIKMAHYHRIYFPHPGFVADGLVLRRHSAGNLPPVGSVDRVQVEGGWIDLLLLRERIQKVTADGLHVVIPPVGSEANKQDFPPGSSSDFTGPTTLIEELDLRDARLEIQRVGGGAYEFPIQRLLIYNLSRNARISYVVDMQNAMPTGQIHASGSFGPLLANQVGATPVTGRFTFSAVRLSDISPLDGTLAASGSFAGRLQEIEAKADATVPDFAIGQGQPTSVSGTTTAAVNALNGGVTLRAVDVRLNKSVLHVAGDITGAKAADLDFVVKDGRTEDLLHPFLTKRPPVVGAIALHSHVRLAPGQAGKTFWQRMSLDGSFQGAGERLTDAAMEQSLSAFSERARSKQDAAANGANGGPVSALAGGTVSVRDGIAHTSRLAFAVPGASVELKGVLNLRNENVNLEGDLRMETNLSHVTTGFKSLLLKPFAPFFRRKGAGAVVPVKVTGSPGHYKIGQNIVPW
jgi:hypothetical protein